MTLSKTILIALLHISNVDIGILCMLAECKDDMARNTRVLLLMNELKEI